MKKLMLVLLVLASILLSGCSQNEIETQSATISELEQIIAEKDKIISEKDEQISDMTNDIAALQLRVDNYKKEIDELENGASKLLTEVLNAYEAGKYKETVRLAKEFHKKHNGTPEDTKVQEIAELAQAELDKIEAEKPATTTTTPAQTTKPAEPQETVTLGMKNALTKAKSYLDFMAFSYSGLIDQLEFEGFSSSEAKYGADNCGADWNEQAAKKAASYLDFMSFSRSGLIEQLEFEGFTHSQAVYGVEAVGY